MKQNLTIHSESDFKDILNKQSSYLVKLLNGKILIRKPIYLKAFFVFLFIASFNPLNVLKVVFYDIKMQISLSLIFIWIYLGVVLLNKYHFDVYSKFWLKLYQIFEEKAIPVEANKKINTKIKYFSKLIIFVWTLLLVVAIIISVDKLKFMDINGIYDYQLILLSIQVSFVGYLTGLGFEICFKMLFTIYYLSKNKKYNIPFNPLNDDDLGNYSVIENFSFKTTLYLLSGLLFIPFLTLLANSSDIGKDKSSIYIIALIIIFSLVTIFSLIYPLVKGYDMSKESKNQLIIEIRKKQYSLIDRYDSSPEESLKNRIEMLDYKMKSINEIAIFPFKGRIWIKIISMGFLPALSYLLQSIISEIDILELLKLLILK